MCNKQRQSGFTLIELLVAIAIFAVLSLMGWKVFDYLIKVKDRNAHHEVQLIALQDAYQQFLRDSLQIVPLIANENGQLLAPLSLNDQVLSFSKAGVTDPLNQDVSPYERIEYRYDAQQKKLYRLKYAGINLAQNTQPQSSELLSGVESYRVSVLVPVDLPQWPQNIDPNDLNQLKNLPKGIKVNLNVDGTEYEWIYSLLDTQTLNSTRPDNGNPP